MTSTISLHKSIFTRCHQKHILHSTSKISLNRTSININGKFSTLRSNKLEWNQQNQLIYNSPKYYCMDGMNLVSKRVLSNNGKLRKNCHQNSSKRSFFNILNRSLYTNKYCNYFSHNQNFINQKLFHHNRRHIHYFGNNFQHQINFDRNKNKTNLFYQFCNIFEIHKRFFASIDTSQDYYKILGVSQSASKDDIGKAFRKLAKEWHPDVHATKSESERKKIREKFQAINQAYETLSSDDLRKKYDDMRRYGFGSPRGFGGSQGFTYNDFGGRQRSGRASPYNSEWEDEFRRRMQEEWERIRRDQTDWARNRRNEYHKHNPNDPNNDFGNPFGANGPFSFGSGGMGGNRGGGRYSGDPRVFRPISFLDRFVSLFFTFLLVSLIFRLFGIILFGRRNHYDDYGDYYNRRHGKYPPKNDKYDPYSGRGGGSTNPNKSKNLHGFYDEPSMTDPRNWNYNDPTNKPKQNSNRNDKLNRQSPKPFEPPMPIRRPSLQGGPKDRFDDRNENNINNMNEGQRFNDPNKKTNDGELIRDLYERALKQQRENKSLDNKRRRENRDIELERRQQYYKRTNNRSSGYGNSNTNSWEDEWKRHK